MTCGGVRSLTGRSCDRCHELEPPRAPVEGDRLPPPRPGRPPAGPQEAPLHQLPAALHADFQARIERLPSSSIVHIPVDQRERHARIVTQLLDGMANGDEAACRLEAARTKLLLAPAPRGANLRVELAKRLQLWQEGSYVELLVRAEDQHRERTRARAALRGASTHGNLARRARMLMAEGAYSKAASSLSTEIAQLTEEEQRAWGTKLLPSSTRPAQALASPEAAPEAPADADATERQPYVLKGV